MGRQATADFVVDTIGHCFFCMEEMSPQQLPSSTSSLAQPGSSSSSSIYSMLYLSRYLKIKMRKVFNEDAPVPQYLLRKVEMSTLKVSLCEECASWNSRLSELLRKLEKIEIEAASYLRLIHGKLQRAVWDEKGDICSKFADRCSDSELMGKLEVAETLRNETIERCSQKINGAQLEVKIQKLSEKDIEILKQPKSSCNFAIKTSVGVNSESGVTDVKLETSNTKEMGEESENEYLYHFEEQSEGSTSTKGSISPTVDHNSGSSSPKVRMNLKQNYLKNSRTGKYECKLCAKTFSFKSVFDRHYQSIHLKLRFKCKTCNKEFTQQGDLKTHQNSVHLKLRVKCQFCNKSFSSPRSRRRHISLMICQGVKTNSNPFKPQHYSQSEPQDQIDATIKFEVKTEANLGK